ncbi:MAG: DUF3368 domain-containing protein [Thermoplasmatota archaeon]
MLVFDATPLIYLAKAGVLHLLSELNEEKVIPESVHREVVEEGKKKGFPDARKIEKLIEDEAFEVLTWGSGELYYQLVDNSFISKADIDVLEIADEDDGVALMDEDYSRSIAEVEGIECRGSVYLVFRLLKEGVIDDQKAMEMIDKMIEEGWYCSTELYSQIVGRLR